MQIKWDAGTTIAAITIFAGTYLFIAIGKLPGYQLDRAGAALLGASLMVGLGVVSLDQAYRAIDFDTITLLLGMMIVVANLRLSGFFRLVSNWVVARPPALGFAFGVVAGFRRVRVLSRQRYDLPGHDAARARSCHPAQARSSPIPAGDRDGLERRQHRDNSPNP